MLYVTTRDDRDPVTAYRALREIRSPDGGFYLPFRHPHFSEAEIDSLKEKSFGQCVAEVLNRLLHTQFTGWDLDFYCGRNPVRLHSLGHKVFVAEAWHTTTERFEQLARFVSERVCGNEYEISDWINIAVRAAVWFGLCGEWRRSGIDMAEVSVVSGDFKLPISAWYARRWGIPIGRIVCACNENNAVWELFAHGQMRTDAVSVRTMIPEADVAVPEAMERLVYEAGGSSETSRYLDCCRRGIPYYPGDSVLSRLRNGLYVSVVSSNRLETVIPNVFRTHGYIMAPGTALAYSGMLDYRAKMGQTGPVIIWAEENPAFHADVLNRIMGIPQETI